VREGETYCTEEINRRIIYLRCKFHDGLTGKLLEVGRCAMGIGPGVSGRSDLRDIFPRASGNTK